jgi:hypothetical protein
MLKIFTSNCLHQSYCLFFQAQRVHYGLVTVSDGKCRPQTSRLKLTADTLVLQKEEFIFPDDEDGYPVDNKVK